MTLVTRYNGLCRPPDFEKHPYCSSISAASWKHLHFKPLPTSPVRRSICSLTSTAVVDVAIKWSLGEKLMSALKLADPCLRVFANLLRIEVLVSAVQEILTMRCLHMMSEP